MNSRRKQKEYFNHLKIMNEEEMEETETETTGGEDDDEMKEVDDMIIKASRELEQVVEENQQLSVILNKPRHHPEELNLIFSCRGDQNYFVQNGIMKQLEETEEGAKVTADIIYKLKTRVRELLNKEELTEEETKELDLKNIQLKESMRLLQENTIQIQNLIDKTNLVNNEEVKEKNSSINSPRATTNNTDEKNIFKTPNFNTNKKCDNVMSGICSCCSENVRHMAPSIPNFAKKLCQSYSMQEKLASENASLESIRFKLQEELLNKDQSLECLERELGHLQTEMKLISRENTILNEKLEKLQQKKEYTVSQNQQKPPGCGIRIKEYSDNIYQLEKQLRDMESDVKCLQEEICAVQLEREHLEKHRKMMCKSKPCVTPYSRYPFKPINNLYPTGDSGSSWTGQGIEQYSGQYNVLHNNIKTKMSEIIALKTDYERLRNLTTEAEEFNKFTDNNTKECEKLMIELKAENKITSEQESKFAAAKNRLRRAQESLKEHKILISDQKKQLEDVGNKCLEVQQKLEQQKIQINSKIEICDGDGFNTGAQIISNLQDKLGEMTI